MIYKSEWKNFDLNKDFWKEVLENTTIVKVNFSSLGIESFELDNGEVVFLHLNENNQSTLMINN